jgi:DNA modification methylase
LSKREWENRIVGWDVVSPDQLLAHPGNWRRHPGRQREALRGSLEQLGWVAPVLVSRNSGHLIDGHARVEEALTNGCQVPIAYVDLTEDEEALALLSLDPIAAMAEADKQALDALLQEAATSDPGLQRMLDDLARQAGLYVARNPVEDPGAEMDRADELQEKWGCELGQIWEAGAHRIACGDCLDIALVERLLADQRCHICWTDPPWNVAMGESNHPNWKKRTILNDNLGDAFPAFASQFCRVIAEAVLPGAPIYMAIGASEWPPIHTALTAVGFHWSSTIIWVKDTAVLSRKDYHARYEPLWYGWREGASRLVPLTDRKQNDVWEIPRPKRSDEHPTMKPVELVVRSLGNSSHPGDLVFEPFLGSGTTAVAAEQTGRACRAIELEPKYVAVTLERLEGMGLAPRCDESTL